MTTHPSAPPEDHPGLHDEMLAVEARHTIWHWHVYLSDEGRLWAVCMHSTFGGSGTTVDGSTPAQVDHEIAVTEHAWAVAA